MEDKRNMESVEPVELYLAEIRKIPPLSEEEKLALPLRAKAGTTEALNRLAEAHLAMVVEIAREYEGRGLHILDLIQEGNNGLIRAVKEFDWASDGEFAPFAHIRIRRSIRSAFDSACIDYRIPLERIEQVNRVVRAREELRQQLGREPAPEEVARSLGISEEKIRHFCEESPEEEDDLILEPEAEESATPEDMLREALETDSRLTCREKAVLSYRFGLDGLGTHTPEETGRFFGITRERVWLIENKFFRHRHSPGQEKKIRDFYG